MHQASHPWAIGRAGYGCHALPAERQPTRRVPAIVGCPTCVGIQTCYDVGVSQGCVDVDGLLLGVNGLRVATLAGLHSAQLCQPMRPVGCFIHQVQDSLEMTLGFRVGIGR